MRYKEYGQTGKKVSVIGFGGMRFLKEDYTKSFEKCAEIMVAANELGINYFDTAPIYYAGGLSEDIFGVAFKQFKKPYYVSTKSLHGQQNTSDFVRAKLEVSLRRMNVEKVNFFHIWCLLNYDQYQDVMKKGGAYEGALKAKEEGLIDHICFSTHATGKEIETIISDNCFEGVTLGYNAINFPYREQGIQAAYKAKKGVVIMNPLGGGTIPKNPEKFDFLKLQEKDSIAVSAIKFLLAHKEVTTALVGIDTMEHLKEVVAAGDHAVSITEEQLEGFKSHILGAYDTLCTGCGYCTGCPSEIDIPKYMDAYNVYILEGKKQSIVNQLSDMWNLGVDGAKKCTACGLCEEKCTQKLPISKRMKLISEIGAQ